MIDLLIAAMIALFGRESPPERAELHAASAMIAAGDDLEPTLLLALAFTESRYIPTAVSRARGRWICGVLQTAANIDRTSTEDQARGLCALNRDLLTSYLEGARRVRYFRARARSIAKAIDGYACGNYGLSNPCRPDAAGNTYGDRVLAHARRLSRLIERRKES